jgi:hypothetical protein
MKIDFDFTLPDGRTVFCEALMQGPDPDVGIFGLWVDELEVTDEQGNPVELNDAEDEAVCMKASEIAADRDSDDY